jgi:TonB-linked SusC/RagA family outer membrane protein
MKKILLSCFTAGDGLLHSVKYCRKLISPILLLATLQVSAYPSPHGMFPLKRNPVVGTGAFNNMTKNSDFHLRYDELHDLNSISVPLKKSGSKEVPVAFSGEFLHHQGYEHHLTVIPPVEDLLAQHEISGTVTDTTGAPLVGVTVKVKGSTQGTVTDAKGAFVLEVPDDATLEVSYIGYQTQEIAIGNTTHLSIRMKIASSGLNEVVVVGYGTERKKDLTGAVSQVSGEVLDNRSLPNLTQGLQGEIPNLNLTMLDGKPIQSPAFNIRGTTSIGQEGNALVLIDGVEGDPSMINPNDVASVTVLKDAASAAIYGARGAYGVVLITTKNAKKGKTSITYSSNYSFKSPTAIPDEVTNGYLWSKMFSEAWSATYNYTQIAQNVNKTQKFSQEYLDALKKHDEDPSLPKTELNADGEYVYYHNTDWYALLYKPHNFAVDQNISISGSSDKASFYITGRYYNQTGLFRYNSDNYRMYNFRAKGSVQVFPWLEVNNNISYSNMTYHNPLNVGEGGGIWRNMSDEAHATAPLLNPDGTLTYSAAYTVGDLYYGKNGIDFNNRLLTNTTAFVAKFFNDHFTVNGNFTFQNTNDNQKRIRVPVPYSTKPGVIDYVGLNYNDLQSVYNKTGYVAANLYAEYENTFNGIHHFKAMIGYNFEQSAFDSTMVLRNGLIYPDAQSINLALGQAVTTGGDWKQWDILGGFFRFNYGYKDRYLLEVNGRYDGSSKFPTNQQFGFFPSVSAGWRISNESFWHVSEKAISDLKIRASYGSLGNGNIDPYTFLETLRIIQSSRVLNGQLPATTSRPAIIPNGLTWETSTTEDLGLDMTLLNNRLSFTGDGYIRRTTNMFTVGPTVPDVLGAAIPKGNYADLKTSGWEFTVSWQNEFNLRTKPFHYSIGFNLSHYTSIITKYNNPDKKLSDYYVGENIGDIWGYVNDGYWTSKDVDQAAQMNKNISNNSSVWLPGDIKYKDLNGDGVISHGNQTVSDPGDMKIIGNITPRFAYGVNLGADWNSIFFSVFFQGTGRTDWYPSSDADAFWGQYNRPYNAPLKSQVGNIWSEDDPNAYWPRYRGYVALSGDRELSVPQTKYLQNAAYIRLKNIQLGYNLPTSLLSKARITAARVYVSGANLWVWSPMFKITDHNIDPESIHGSDRVLTAGRNGDVQNYPILKSITVGLSVTF